jgi:hypothetical protein
VSDEVNSFRAASMVVQTLVKASRQTFVVHMLAWVDDEENGL